MAKEEMTVQELVKKIADERKNNGASKSHEAEVMRSLMNDTEFHVGVFTNAGGHVDDYYPGREFRGFVKNAVAGIAKINKDEAEQLVANHTFSNSDAVTMVGFSKQFIDTYMDTGRKMNLGGREDHNVSLSKIEFQQTTRRFPSKERDANGNVVLDEHGEPKYTNEHVTVPAHSGMKASCPCPKWVSEKFKK